MMSHSHCSVGSRRQSYKKQSATVPIVCVPVSHSEKDMKKAASSLEFERAAELRDVLIMIKG